MLLDEQISVEAQRKVIKILGIYEKILRRDDTIPEF